MNILAHRGYWTHPKEKNTLSAFKRAFELGFGIETDFRDQNGQLVISHDIPGSNALLRTEFCEMYKKFNGHPQVAINIKSDGLHLLIKKMMDECSMNNSFVFDMSIPDMRGYLSQSTPTYMRISDYESDRTFVDKCEGIWLDAFDADWYDQTIIKSFLDSGKKVSIVSPELHGRNHLSLWKCLHNADLSKNDGISLCTDYPVLAREYFDEKN